MQIIIFKNRLISELQEDFNRAYPFLKIEFYKKADPALGIVTKKHFKNTLPVKAAGLTNEGFIDISDSMTVAQLEKSLFEKFGLSTQVSRRSGMMWLETTITDKWTLKQQNDHGREISEAINEVWNPGNGET